MSEEKGLRHESPAFDICPSCGTNWDNATACCSKEKFLDQQVVRLESRNAKLVKALTEIRDHHCVPCDVATDIATAALKENG